MTPPDDRRVAYVLLVPNDPALLDGEGFGHRPPMMFWDTWEMDPPGWESAAGVPVDSSDKLALVLAADGKVLRSGVDHLCAPWEPGVAAGVIESLRYILGGGVDRGLYFVGWTTLFLDHNRRPMEAHDADR